MPIRIGTENIGDIYVGTERIAEVYVGTELVWQRIVQIVFDAVATYSGARVSAATTSVPVSSISTAGSTAAWAVDSVDTFADNLATDGASSISSGNFVITGGGSAAGAPTGDTCTPRAVTQANVFTGTTYSTASTGTATQNYNNYTGHTPYTVTETQEPISTSDTDRTTTARGTVPNDPALYSNANAAIAEQVTVPISGDTANPTPNQNVPGVGSRGPGTYNGSPFSQARASQTVNTSCGNANVSGTGTMSVTINDPADVTEGDDVSFTASVNTSYTPTPAITYAWTFSGAGVSPTSSSAASPTVSTSNDGTLLANLSVSHAGDEGSTFSANAAEVDVDVASAAPPPLSFTPDSFNIGNISRATFPTSPQTAMAYSVTSTAAGGGGIASQGTGAGAFGGFNNFGSDGVTGIAGFNTNFAGTTFSFSLYNPGAQSATLGTGTQVWQATGVDGSTATISITYTLVA